jgi:NADH dehydrogenase
VDDVAAAVVTAVEGHAPSGIYELGGPVQGTLRSFIDRMLSEIHRRRLVLNFPTFVGRVMGGVLDAASAATIGLFPNTILTGDQARQLESDNVVSGNYPGFAELGIAPTHMDVILPTYLWRFRPSGQYDSIKDSAKALADRLDG